MRAFIDKALGQLREFFSKMTKKEKIRLFVLVLLIVVLAIVAVALLGRTKYVDLYTGLPPDEAGRIIAVLDEMGVPTKKPDVGTIQVPEGLAISLKMQLAADGFSSNEPDLSILNSANGFGVTDQQQRMYEQYQKAKDIRDFLLSVPMIKNAKVDLNFGKDSAYVFSQNMTEATCAVTLELTDPNTKLTQLEANTLIMQIAYSAPGLKIENVKLMDSNINSYVYSEEEILPETDVNEEIAYRIALEDKATKKLEEQVNKLLAPAFGVNGFRASVTVRLDFDDIKIHSVEFAPPVPGETEGMMRSMSDMEKTAREEGAAEGPPGTDTNLMGTEEYPYETADNDELLSERLLEINYEMDELTTEITRAKGDVAYLSIGVFLNSTIYTEDYREQVRNVVAGAIGTELEYVSVEQVPFQQLEVMGDAELEYYVNIQQEENVKEFIRLGVMVLLGIALLILVFVIAKMFAPPKPEPQPQPQPVLAGVAAGAGAPGGVLDYVIGGGEDGRVEDRDIDEEEEEPEEEDELFNYQDVEISAKLSGVLQLEKFIEKDPKAVAQLLRNWLTDD